MIAFTRVWIQNLIGTVEFHSEKAEFKIFEYQQIKIVLQFPSFGLVPESGQVTSKEAQIIPQKLIQ